MTKIEMLSVGSPYPKPLPSLSEGAIAEFLRSTNTLMVTMPNIDKREAQALRKGTLYCGLLAKESAILLIWQFCDKKERPMITLDSPFDARIISDINLHDITNSKQRLLIDIHIVDSATNIIKGLRGITMPHDLTLAFLSAVQEQLSSADNSDHQMQTWMMQEPINHAKSVKMYKMGE